MKKIISLLLIVSMISCNDDDNSNTNLGQTEADVIEYIEANNLDAERTSLGTYYVIEEQGEGKTPTSDAYVVIDYKGYFLDGEVFDMSNSEGVSFDLLNVIPGFADGIVNFNEGGKGTILIPSNLAYGDSGISGVIPGGAVLVFDVEVLTITNPQSEDDIIEYLELNSLEAERSNTGLYYIIEEEGTGDPITETSTVTVAYTGYFLDGTEFDSSSENGVQFNLQNVIPGFQEGITHFKEGGKGTLLLPPNLGYGSEGSSNIPRNTVLIFDIVVKSLD